MKIIWAVWAIVLWPFVQSESKKPHIITILIDDLGWHDVGYHGNDQIKTPNIDALAYSGTILSRHYVLPTCTPSRSALLTGSYPIRSGMHGYPLRGGENRNLPLDFKLAPAHMKDLGYRTHMIGKWHLGYQTYNHVPNHRGFDTFFGYYNGFIDYYTYCYNQTTEVKNTYFYGYDMHYNDFLYRVNETKYATHLFTEKAQQVIRNHNNSEPLYLYLAHLATHTGNDDFMGMQAPKEEDVDKAYPHIKDYARRVFAGCLEDLDRSIGIVVEELKNKNMLENSIILVMSDNGGHTVSVDMSPNWSSNWPLAGTKFTLYEGGVRGLALIWSPLLPKGFVNDQFLHITDWLPTFYSAAGGDVKNLSAIDGVDQWEALKNLKTVKRDHLLININERVNAESIIIDERWKIIKGGFPNYGNYDLHWGKEENVAPNPPYNFTNIFNSKVGKIIQNLSSYEHLLEPKRIKKLRDGLGLKCEPTHIGVTEGGHVPKENEHRCPDHCIFDLINDPCELQNFENEEILNVAKKYLKYYREKLVPQKNTTVDVESDPKKFDGAWMPWDYLTCAKSAAKYLTLQYLTACLVLLTCYWYSFCKRKNC